MALVQETARAASMDFSGVTGNLMGTFETLLSAPSDAAQLWPVWGGFAAIEYFSDWAQVTAMAMTDDLTYKRIIGALTRGAVLTTNLVYFQAATNQMPMV